MQDPRSSIQDPGSWVQDPVSRILAVKWNCGLPGSVCSILQEHVIQLCELGGPSNGCMGNYNKHTITCCCLLLCESCEALVGCNMPPQGVGKLQHVYHNMLLFLLCESCEALVGCNMPPQGVGTISTQGQHISEKSMCLRPFCESLGLMKFVSSM